MQRKLSILLCAILIALSIPSSVKATESFTSFAYTGEETKFVAPYTGEYKIELTGAQGGKSTSKSGGKGGKIVVTARLERGDVLTVNVGGQDGYNGGGTGKVSNGGGATVVSLNNTILAIAGGGGGATSKKDGGAGGALGSLSSFTSLSQGTSSTASGTAGGGAGATGGSIGRWYQYTGSVTYTIYWRCSGGTTTGTANHDLDGTGRETWRYNYAKSTYIIEKTEPTSDISASVAGMTTWNWDGDRYQNPYYFNFSSTYGNYERYMGNETTPTSFSTQYTKDDVTVTTNTQSGGGTSWYNSAYSTLAEYATGAQEGDGMCTVTLISVQQLNLDNAIVSKLYYDNVEVKKLYFNNTLIYLK